MATEGAGGPGLRNTVETADKSTHVPRRCARAAAARPSATYRPMRVCSKLRTKNANSKSGALSERLSALSLSSSGFPCWGPGKSVNYMIGPIWTLAAWALIGAIYFFVLHDRVVELIARLLGRKPEEV